MAIHQLVHTLSYGDAISGEVFSLQRCFKESGASEIFAINIHPKYKGLAHDYRELGSDFSGSLVLHYSLGSPLNQIYLANKQSQRALIYHNLTPAHWFKGVNPRIVRDIEQGMQELPVLCQQSNLLIADSEFNAGELKSLGFDAQVLELPIDPKRWEVPVNPGIYSILKSDPGIHVLHVGRLAPNKCIEDIIKIFYFLHYHVNPKSKLWLVGIDIDTEIYSYCLKRLVYELNLERAVNFVGCLADTELRAMYEACSVYLCMSEHEGFCLPVLEAMNFGLPVISSSGSALPQTVGAGGILISEKRHAEIAELIGYIDADADFRQKMVRAGHERIQQFAFDRFRARVKDLFNMADLAQAAHY